MLGGRVMQVLRHEPALLEQLYLMASEVVDDFEDYGPVHQASEAGEYDETTVIRKLQKVRNEIIELSRSGAVDGAR